MTHVVGLDPSLTSFGIAVVSGGGSAPLVARVKSVGKRGDDVVARQRRIADLGTGVLEYVPANALVVMEGPAYSSNTSGVWDRAGLWHDMLRRLISRGHEVVVCPPTSRAMYATGKGNAGKDAVLAAVVRRYPDIEVTGNDEADALVMAAMGARLLGHPLEESMPQSHLRALAGLELPDTMDP